VGVWAMLEARELAEEGQQTFGHAVKVLLCWGGSDCLSPWSDHLYEIPK